MYNEEKVNKILEKVKERLRKSSKEYKDAYVVNNITKELNDEFYDIVGWMLLMSYRMIEASEKVIYEFDNIYWDAFLENQDTDFLARLQVLVTQELKKRLSDTARGIPKKI